MSVQATNIRQGQKIVEQFGTNSLGYVDNYRLQLRLNGIGVSPQPGGSFTELLFIRRYFLDCSPLLAPPVPGRLLADLRVCTVGVAISNPKERVYATLTRPVCDMNPTDLGVWSARRERIGRTPYFKGQKSWPVFDARREWYL